MNIEQIRDALPDYARDLKLNLGSVLTTNGAPGLSEKQIWAIALASSIDDGRHLPSVVTLASCDSAAQGSVTSPGGSVAHDLHASGIPLVVGSQFPISEQASIPFTETFYRGQLAGEHPLVSINDVRRELATEFSDEHA